MRLSLKKQEELYENGIVGLYDRVQDIVDALDDPEIKNLAEQYALAEPVLEQAQKTIDQASEGYLECVDEGHAVPSGSRKIEGAIRQLFVAVGKFNRDVKNIAQEECEEVDIEDIKNKVDPEEIAALLDRIETDIPVEELLKLVADKLPKNSLQQSLIHEAKRLGKKFGGLLVRAVRRLSDQSLSLMYVLHSIGVAVVKNAIPNRTHAEYNIQKQLNQRFAAQIGH